MKIKSLFSKWPIKGVLSFNILNNEVRFYSNCDDYLISRYYYSGFDEEIREIEVLNELIKPNGIFFDIGSYNGLFSILLGKKHSDLKIVSFEPNPSNFDRVKYNISLNHLTNIQFFNLGMSDHPGKLDFFLPDDLSLTTVSSFSSNFFENHSNTKSVKKEIEVISIDSFCTENDCYPNYIKIDVEGHELEVLLGGQKILKKYKPAILCEIFTKAFESSSLFDSNLPKVSQINSILKEIGYEMFILEEKKLIKIDSLNIDNQGRNFLFIANEE